MSLKIFHRFISCRVFHPRRFTPIFVIRSCVARRSTWCAVDRELRFLPVCTIDEICAEVSCVNMIIGNLRVHLGFFTLIHLVRNEVEMPS
jgi:hypothetical protein